MAYTVKKLAELSGVTVRTLHHYDEVGLLKPAYYGTNGYRYYEEEQLLLLQQILFFRELDFPLDRIKKILGRDDFNQIIALTSHRRVLEKKLQRTEELIGTIDLTIKHLKKKCKIKENQMFKGFSQEKQAEYEEYLIRRCGEQARKHIAESKENRKKWSKEEEKNFWKVWDEMMQKLVKLQPSHTPRDKEVQAVIRRHYEWISKCWTPTRETYAAHADLIVDSELRNAYEKYHPNLPEFIAEGIRYFAQEELE